MSAPVHVDKLSAQARLTVAVVGLSTFLMAMGGSVVAVALPEIGRHLSISLEQSSWVMLSFLLTTTATMLPAGQVGDSYGLKRAYLAGFGIIGAATLACGLSDHFSTLVAARAFHGLGGALVMATGPALLTTSVPPRQRGTVLGVVATATYAGLTLGPTIGGLLVSFASWRWVFLFNVPVTLVVLFVGGRYLPRGVPSRAGLDFPGAATLILAVPALMLPLALVARAGWLPWMGPSLGLAALLLALFVWLQARVPRPLIALSLFRSRTFVGATLSAVCNYVGLFSIILLVPFFLEEGKGYTTRETGTFLSIQPLLMALGASWSGRLSDRIGTRALAVGGMVVMAVGIGLVGWTSAETSVVQVALGLAVVGLGTGIFISPNSSALMGSAPHSRQGTASAVLGLSRNFGMLVGTAMSAALFYLAGGRTGSLWEGADYGAYGIALGVAAGVVLLGSVIAALRGDTEG